MITTKLCPACDGVGFFWVANGPDDVEKEYCEICEGDGYIRVDDEEDDDETI